MFLKILFLGEVVGITSVKSLGKKLRTFIENNNVDMCIINGDGASDGYGLLAETAIMLLKSGVNVITGGDCIFNKKSIKEFLTKNYNIVRPFNLDSDSPGRGFVRYRVSEGVEIGVISLLGRINFNKIFASDPYKSVDYAIDKLRSYANLNTIIVDFHGGTTGEIQTLQWYLAGRVSAVIGTGMRVLTSDSRILKDYTGVITGAGYCGGMYSVSGFSPDVEISKIRTGRFAYSKIEKEDPIMQGVLMDIDHKTGKTNSIDIINQRLDSIGKK